MKEWLEASQLVIKLTKYYIIRFNSTEVPESFDLDGKTKLDKPTIAMPIIVKEHPTIYVKVSFFFKNATEKMAVTTITPPLSI